ncbi:MAG: biotin synthase BioB [Desulfobulbaceae bacterium]|nr:biotin synthase BioB [Desulfobulbaceae bacterium]
MTETLSGQLDQMRRLPLPELMAEALRVKLARRGDAFSLCSIINAKSGQCGEDCRFCVQSARYHTDAPVYPLVDADKILTAAREAQRIGARHFSIVTSGRGLTGADLDRVVEMVAMVRDRVGIRVCASLGILARHDFERLRAAGLSRYHHNLETSREFFPRVVTTHSFAHRIETIAAAREAGLEVCAGGIFGLGESEEDRISMALSLRECQVDSVPINVLIPLPGTPLAEARPLAMAEILRSIALYRLIMPEKPIRLAAGRETALGDFLSSALMAGADGMMIGGYLTQRGRSPEADQRLVAEMQGIWRG